MRVRLKEKWMGYPPGMVMPLSDDKARDLIVRNVATEVPEEKNIKEKKQPHPQKDKMYRGSNAVTK